MKTMPGAITRARELLKRLSEAETTEGLRMTQEQLDFLDDCAAGHPPRNALAAITAIRLKLEYTQRKPKQEIEVTEVAVAQEVTDEEWAALSTLRHQVRADEPGEPEAAGG